MKKKIIGIISFLLVISLFVGLTHMLSGSENSFGTATEKISFGIGDDITESVVSGNYIAAENSKFVMSLDTLGNPIITDKSTGNIWKSTNDYADGDKYTSSIIAHYLSGNSAKSEYLSSEHSAAKNQMRVYAEENGVKVEYAFGEIGEDYIYPEQISQKRFESLIEKMSDQDAEYLGRLYILYELKYYSGSNKEFLLSQYPRLEKENIYILTDSISKKQQRKMDQIFRSIGYTEEDRVSDNDGAATEVERQCAMRISVKYSLTDNGFKATIDTNDCLFYAEYPLLSIDLLPYFGSFMSEDKGYMLLPSGSGAIMNVGGEVKKDANVSLSVYGENLSVNSIYNSKTDCSLPVFGLYKNGYGYLCILEKGEQQATIKAERNNFGSSVYSSFDVLDNKGFKIGVQGEVFLTSSGLTTDTIATEYILFNQLDEKSAYSVMANSYRKYLEETEMLKGEASNSPLLLAEFINTINYDTVAYGIFPTNREFAMTTFEKTGQISSEISKWAGSQNTKVLLTGYNIKGLNSGKLGKITYSKAAGGKEEYIKLQEKLSDLGIDVFLDLPFSVIRSNTVANASSVLSRNINNSIARLKTYNIQTDKYNQSNLALVTPENFNSLWQNYLKQGIKSSGVGVSQLTSVLYGNYADGKPVSRGAAVDEITKTLSAIKKEKLNLLGNGVNLFTLKYLDVVNNIPLNSSKNNVFDKEVPFLQMVLHGYVDYVGEVTNNVADRQYNILKHIETGSGMHWLLTGEEYENIFETQYSYLYDTNYTAHKNDMKCDYLEVSKVLENLGNAKIVEHIFLTDDVVKVSYDTGDVIYINYGHTEYKDNHITLKAQNYLRVKK